MPPSPSEGTGEHYREDRIGAVIVVSITAERWTDSCVRQGKATRRAQMVAANRLAIEEAHGDLNGVPWSGVDGRDRQAVDQTPVRAGTWMEAPEKVEKAVFEMMDRGASVD